MDWLSTREILQKSVERSGRRTAGAGQGEVQDAPSIRAGLRGPVLAHPTPVSTFVCGIPPGNSTVKGRFMTRPIVRGGVRLRTFLFALALCAPAISVAADAAFTDRIIVKYRGGGAISALTQARQRRGTDAPAARHGVVLDRVRTTALGSQVLRVDRRLSLAEAERLAADIAASDPNVEYAEPDRIMRHTFTPNDTRYN